LPDDQPSRTDARIDWPGMLLLSGIVLSFMAGLATAPDMGSQPLLLIGVVVLLTIFVTGWVAVERRTATPMFDLRLLARPAIWRSYVVTFATCVGAALSIYLVTQLFAVSGDGYGFGASPTDIGRYLLLAAAMAAISGPLGGLGVRRFGSARCSTLNSISSAVCGKSCCGFPSLPRECSTSSDPIFVHDHELLRHWKPSAAGSLKRVSPKTQTLRSPKRALNPTSRAETCGGLGKMPVSVVDATGLVVP
jgi:multisubunit Na+/H+ antiporter MnhB subunit